MKQALVKRELVHELQTVASYSDQRLADRIDVSRLTVRTARKKFENDLFTYLGTNFINYRVQELMKTIERLKKKIDELELLKSKSSEKAIKIGHHDELTNRQFSYIDIKYTPPSINELTRINKLQVRIEYQITQILSHGVLKVIIPPTVTKLEKSFPFEE